VVIARVAIVRGRRVRPATIVRLATTGPVVIARVAIVPG
jgi:hypothetical protein